MSSPVRALIDLSALRHNIKRVREITGNRKILAMVKSNGYGHGAFRIAQTIKNYIDGFGVSSLEEGLELRKAHIDVPIIIMSRFWKKEQLSDCSPNRLGLVIHDLYQIEILEKNPQSLPLNIWLKLETGMHRLGLTPEQFRDAWRRLQKLSWIQKPLVLMTHFACADQPSDPLTSQQIRTFQQVTRDLPGPKSLANSAAILSHPESLADWVRPGIMLYGASPFADKTAQELDLHPVMTLSAPLIAIKNLTKGDTIGYGATWRCPENMPVGVVAIGYGDAYPRHAPSGTPVLVNGVSCPIVGRISMDILTIDLRSAINPKIGDSVILWGRGLPVEKIAAYSQTISYELFCKVTSRVEFSEHE